jgi:hypothetical protein
LSSSYRASPNDRSTCQGASWRARRSGSANRGAGSCEGLALLACFIMCAFKWRQRGHCCSFTSGDRRIPVAGNKGRGVQRSATRRVSALPLATSALSRASGPSGRQVPRALVVCLRLRCGSRTSRSRSARRTWGCCYCEAGKQQPVERGGTREGSRNTMCNARFWMVRSKSNDGK